MLWTVTKPALLAEQKKIDSIQEWDITTTAKESAWEHFSFYTASTEIASTAWWDCKIQV